MNKTSYVRVFNVSGCFIHRILDQSIKAQALYIRELVDSLCRDGDGLFITFNILVDSIELHTCTDGIISLLQMKLPNAAVLSYFRHIYLYKCDGTLK